MKLNLGHVSPGINTVTASAQVLLSYPKQYYLDSCGEIRAKQHGLCFFMSSAIAFLAQKLPDLDTASGESKEKILETPDSPVQAVGKKNNQIVCYKRKSFSHPEQLPKLSLYN